jgi:hypothetical protein
MASDGQDALLSGDTGLHHVDTITRPEPYPEAAHLGIPNNITRKHRVQNGRGDALFAIVVSRLAWYPVALSQ